MILEVINVINQIDISLFNRREGLLLAHYFSSIVFLGHVLEHFVILFLEVIFFHDLHAFLALPHLAYQLLQLLRPTVVPGCCVLLFLYLHRIMEKELARLLIQHL